MKNIWITSDTHFGHEAILRHMPKRGAEFRDIDEMDAAVIDSINYYVKPNDVLYHLGDFCWRAGRAGHYRQRLNVKEIHVTQGNHDASSLRKHVSSMDWMLFRKFNSDFRSDLHFHMGHFPMVSWRKQQHGGYALYGHAHGLFEDQLNAFQPGRRAMDVGVDHAFTLTGEFKPFHLEEILFAMPDIIEGRPDR